MLLAFTNEFNMGRLDAYVHPGNHFIVHETSRAPELQKWLTHHSTGRCAIKPRSAGEFKRYVSSTIRA